MTETQTLVVRCAGCGHEMSISSRSQFGIIEDLHRDACDIDALRFEGDVDTLLALPPFDSATPTDNSAGIRINLNDL
ncbi:MAG: hypothetical protein JO246_06425 [Frankiaceae bacterium]|nr:hypothetical protein [Frankiaceae bacterium]MBV9870834.1 hypothetical protein [Frankiaceae bacterium]